MIVIRVVGNSHDRAKNWFQNCGWFGRRPLMSLNSPMALTSSASSHSVAAPAASRVALARRAVRVVSGTRNAPTSKNPTVALAATSRRIRATGTLQRMTAPGSPIA